MAATFYQAAFAALTRWYGPRRVRALTTLTLAGGLASTVFAPITAALAAAVGWRHTIPDPRRDAAARRRPPPLVRAARRLGHRATPNDVHIEQSRERRGADRPVDVLHPAGRRPDPVRIRHVRGRLRTHPAPPRPRTSTGQWPPGHSASAASVRPSAAFFTCQSRSTPHAVQRTTILVLAGAATTILIAAHPRAHLASPRRPPSPPAWSAATSPSFRPPPSPTDGEPPTTRRLTAILSAPITIAGASPPGPALP